MCEFEDQLKELVQQAQQHPLQSGQRRLAIHHLCKQLSQSGRLARPLVPKHLLGSYNEIYNTAIQHLFSYLYQNIEQYNPERGAVLQWVNYLLRIRFPDATREVTQFIKGVNFAEVQRLSLDDLQNSELPRVEETDHPETLQPSSADVVDYLVADPDGAFKQAHVQAHPEATFQFIALRYLEGHSWQEISEILDVPIPTLSSFFQRNLKKFQPQFQTHLAC